MKTKTIDNIYDGFHLTSAISGTVIALSLVGYYSLTEIGISKFNGLFRTIIPVALIEFVISVGAINVIDYQGLRKPYQISVESNPKNK